MLLAAGSAISLGSSTPRVVFGEEERPAGDGVGRRLLLLDEQPAFELSWWCGTRLIRKRISMGGRLSGSGRRARRRAVSTCGWCGGPIIVKATGRLPKWCSASCRQRAWEQARAASSGLAAVQVVERRVETPVALPPTSHDWPRLVGQLVIQLDSDDPPALPPQPDSFPSVLTTTRGDVHVTPGRLRPGR